jgi:hypothetical protein
MEKLLCPEKSFLNISNFSPRMTSFNKVPKKEKKKEKKKKRKKNFLENSLHKNGKSFISFLKFVGDSFLKQILTPVKAILLWQ